MSKNLSLGLGLSFSAINLLFMHYYFVYENLYVGSMFAFTPLFNVLSVISDVSILFLFLYCSTWGRIKLSINLCFLTTLIWSFANIFYSRFFYQCLTLSAFQQASNVFDSIVIKSMLGGFRLCDLYYLLFSIVYLVTYKLYLNKRLPKSGWRKSFFSQFLAIPLVIFGIAFVIYSFYHFLSPKFRHHPELFVPQLKENLINPFVWKSSMPVNTHFVAGSMRFLFSDICDEFTCYDLTKDEKSEIFSEYSNHQLRKTEHPINNSIKNVIFILLESFLSVSSDLYVGGKEITPFLNNLKKDSTIYYNGEILPNITIGESGDGQLIYMSGLLPLKNRITVGIAKRRTLLGLPQILKERFGIKYSEIIIPSSPVLWEQKYMNERYGIDSMLSATDTIGTSAFLINEETVFSLAENTKKEEKQPFFSMVLGISTHQPYNEPVDTEFTIADPSIPIQYNNYLIACHYVDKQIEKYFNFLREKKIYDNSLIIIASDHHPHIDQLHMEGKVSKELPLYIINSGIDVETMYHGRANQLDVYTTILDILGIESEWRGLGYTLLSPFYTNSVDEKKYELSQKIIMGNYFKEIQCCNAYKKKHLR